MVILPDCGPERSVQVAERLRAAVAAAAAAGAARTLTASGVASYPANATDLESLVRAAVDALLVSKCTGRNRTTAATTGASGTAPV